MFFNAGDFFWPRVRALVDDSGGVLSFGLGKCFEGVLQFLFEGGTVHRRKVITRVGWVCLPVLLDADLAVLQRWIIPQMWDGEEWLRVARIKAGHGGHR